MYAHHRETQKERMKNVLTGKNKPLWFACPPRPASCIFDACAHILSTPPFDLVIIIITHTYVCMHIYTHKKAGGYQGTFDLVVISTHQVMSAHIIRLGGTKHASVFTP
jgi:hypothetical protein